MVPTIIADSIRKSGKSRLQIAAEMSELLRLKISQRMLNRYTTQSDEGSRIPAAFVPAFCEVTGDNSLRRFLVGEELCRLLELGESAARLLGREHEKTERSHG